MLPELVKRSLPRRVVGRLSLERRIRGVMVAVARFGRCRAQVPGDLAWCAKAIDALTSLLRDDGGRDG